MGARRKVLRGRRLEQLPTTFAILCGMFALLGVYSAVLTPARAGADHGARAAGHVAHGRQLQEDTEALNGVLTAADDQLPVCNFEVQSDFPRDLLEDHRAANPAWIIVHIIVLLYMFLGLAIVCDDFFEASLSEICASLELKDDVAGATFMAAGGSAPELATSIMGVFVAKSDVGFGTIVGSAIFNVLFVIAACSFVAPNLPLTWWPLVRDSIYYCTSIAVLVAFIVDSNPQAGQPSRQEVEWWEALILLILYAFYIVVMYFNESLEEWVTKRIQEDLKPKPPMRARVARVVESLPFVYTIMVVILVNVFIIIFANLFDSDALFAVNIACSCIFIAEILFKMYAYGVFGCWTDAMNVFDGLLVLLIIAEFAFTGGGSGNLSGLRIVRFIRLARLLRLARIYRVLMKKYTDDSTQTEEADWSRPATGPIPLSEQAGQDRGRNIFEQMLTAGPSDPRPSAPAGSFSRNTSSARVAPAPEVATSPSPPAASQGGSVEVTASGAAGGGSGSMQRSSSMQRTGSGKNLKRSGSERHNYVHKPGLMKSVKELSSKNEPAWKGAANRRSSDGKGSVRFGSTSSLGATIATATTERNDRDASVGDVAAGGAGQQGAGAPAAANASSAAALGAAESGVAVTGAPTTGGRAASSDMLAGMGTTQVEETEEDGDDGSDDGPDEPADPFDIPDSALGKAFWVVAFPLLFTMWVTIPDCRREVFRKYFFVTFFMCIVWIGAMSYVMVWMATLFGITASIPAPVMGLTILAAGTSIPDALSSMAVARKGHGDMAVSSSIGSNIFDILIGLPVPWFISTAMVDPGSTVSIQSEGLGIMIVLLFLMVAAVIILIDLAGWLLLKRLGYAMMFLYFLFLAFSLTLEYQMIPSFQSCILPWEA